jgi:hypothetical protein
MRDFMACPMAMLLVGLGSSCAAVPAPVAPVHNAVELQPGLQVDKTAPGTRISGPELDVVRDEEGFHGHGPLGPVDLREGSSQNFSGVVGSGLAADATTDTSGIVITISARRARTPRAASTRGFVNAGGKPTRRR